VTLWMDVEVEKQDIVVVDCGDINDEGARNRADEIIDLGIGKKNIELGPSNRIFIKIPKTKQRKVFEVLPISDKKTWFGATHSYVVATNQCTRPKSTA